MCIDAHFIKLSSVSFNYTDTAVIAELSLSIQVGEFVSILGPSGCGKTTLLKILAELERPDSGVVEFSSRSGSVRTGLMIQDPALLPWRTTIQNVCLPFEMGQLNRIGLSVATAKALRVLEDVGLKGFEDITPTKLSGGMKARASLARTLVVEHDLQLFDEPFSSVDELTRENLNELVSKLVTVRGTTSVLVTHSIEEAVFLSDRVVVLSDRPATVEGIISVDLPQPRTNDIRESGLFREYVAKVRNHLRTGSD